MDHAFTIVEGALLHLAQGRRQVRVRLADLRERLPLHSRESLDETLIQGQRDGLWVLYRNDVTSSVTAEDHAAALTVGDCPRHLVLLDAPRRERRR